MEKGFLRPAPSIGDFHAETPGFRRLLHCLNCNRLIRMPMDELVAAHGSDASITDVLATITSDECGAASMLATMVKVWPSTAISPGGQRSCLGMSRDRLRGWFPRER